MNCTDPSGVRTVRLGTAFAACAILGCVAATCTPLAAQTPPTLRLVEELRLAANAEDFSTVGPVKVNARGDIAITFRQDAHVRIYDAAGRRVATAGRRGSGPGEFQSFQVQGWLGDTVWIFDDTQQRHTFISRTGRVLRTVRLPQAFVPNGDTPITDGGLRSILAPHAMNADGSVLAMAYVTPARRTNERDAVQAIVHARPNGAIRVVATIPAYDTTIVPPFTPHPLVAYGPDARLVAVATIERFAQTGGQFRVMLLSANGDTVFTKPFPYTGVPIARRTIDSVIQRRTFNAHGHRRSVRPEQIPPVWPPIHQLLLASDGRIWVAIREAGDAVTALVLDHTGTVVARVPLPARAYVQAANATHAWLRVADEDGLADVVRFAFR